MKLLKELISKQNGTRNLLLSLVQTKARLLSMAVIVVLFWKPQSADITTSKILLFEDSEGESFGRFLTFRTSENYGSAFNFPSSSNGRFTDCTFENNQAQGSGGAIGLNGGVLVLISSTFRNNKADGNGGAIYSDYSLSISKCLFENNEASTGGAIESTGGSQISNSIFQGNNAQDGGALHLRGEDQQGVTASFFNNSASGDGGAIYTSGFIPLIVYLYSKCKCLHSFLCL